VYRHIFSFSSLCCPLQIVCNPLKYTAPVAPFFPFFSPSHLRSLLFSTSAHHTFRCRARPTPRSSQAPHLIAPELFIFSPPSLFPFFEYTLHIEFSISFSLKNFLNPRCCFASDDPQSTKDSLIFLPPLPPHSLRSIRAELPVPPRFENTRQLRSIRGSQSSSFFSFSGMTKTPQEAINSSRLILQAPLPSTQSLPPSTRQIQRSPNSLCSGSSRLLRRTLPLHPVPPHVAGRPEWYEADVQVFTLIL